MPNIDSNIANWSGTAASNQPDGTDTNTIAADLQQIQATVRNYLASRATKASGTTVDLSTVAALIASVTHSTGTTAISSFGTVSAGIWKIITFAISGGILTLTHHATQMILPGAANITLGNGESLIAESLGSGNWKVHIRQPASGNYSITGDIIDANSNELIDFVATASAVNQVAITNAAAGAHPKVSATGDDANVHLFLQAKGATGFPALVDSIDATKIAFLNVTGISSGNSRTYTFPDSSGTIFTTATGQATQAQQESGSATDVYVTPGRQQYHPSASKGWAFFGVSGNIVASYSASSVTDNGTGDATLGWTTAFSSAGYSVVATAYNSGGANIYTQLRGLSTTATQIEARNSASGALADPTGYCAASYGDQ